MMHRYARRAGTIAAVLLILLALLTAWLRSA